MDAGECFAIVGKGSYPDAPGRMVLCLLPIPKEQADAACRVALGTHRAVRMQARQHGSPDTPLKESLPGLVGLKRCVARGK